MSKREVPTLVRRAVTSVGTVARHPIAGTARAVGLVKGSAVAAPRLVRHVVAGAPAEPVTASPEPTVAESPPASSGSPDVVPKPVPKPVPEPEDLPEPVVISADEEDAPAAVHHEPKVASRDAAHGRGAGDDEQRAGFVDEIPDDYETESPAVAEPASDEPLLDLGAARAVRREADTLGRAADPRPE